MSVKAPKRKKVGRLELSGYGRPHGPRTALGTAGSPSCSCLRRCAWRDVLSGAFVPTHPPERQHVQRPVGVSVAYIRLRRWRTVLPEEAGTGATPHKRAKDASLLSLSGLSPTATSSEAAVSVPTPRSAARAGTASDTNRARSAPPELGDLLGEPPVTTSNGPHR
jgi:hypothetical protein